MRAERGKCKACRDKGRTQCVVEPGAGGRCRRCATLGLLCVSPLVPKKKTWGLQTQGLRFTPGEYCKELVRPTTMLNTRLAVTRLLEDLTDLQLLDGVLPKQIQGATRMLLLHGQAAKDVARLHAAVSVCAALRIEDSLDTIAAVSETTDREEALVAEIEAFFAHKQALDGVPSEGLASVRQVVHSGRSTITCNDLFKKHFFDASDSDIAALFFDLAAALVDDESAATLMAMNERVAQLSLFEEVPRTRSGVSVITAVSDEPMVLVGRTGERMVATVRVDGSWSPDGSVSVSHVVLIGLRKYVCDVKASRPQVDPYSYVSPEILPDAAVDEHDADQDPFLAPLLLPFAPDADSSSAAVDDTWWSWES